MTAKGYIICSNPRSGTTLLCDLLSRTGVAGAPNSFFREKSMLDWCDWWGVLRAYDPNDPAFTAEYFAAMRKNGRGDTSTFGMRLLGPDLDFARAWLARVTPNIADDRALFEANLGPLHFIHLKRTDKLAEAVSYVRAEQTGLWHANPDGSDLERIAPNGEEGYDRAAIQHRLETLIAYEDAWDVWFSQTGIQPLRITYEDLAHDPIAVLRETLSYLGKSMSHADGVVPGVRKLAGATNADWIARYKDAEG